MNCKQCRKKLSETFEVPEGEVAPDLTYRGYCVPCVVENILTKGWSDL